MSEAAIQADIQDVIQLVDGFSNASVVINDWTILDQSSQNAPYVIILTADDFTSRQDTVTPDTTWFVPILLIVRFVNWADSPTELGTYRQALIDEFNKVSTNRSPGAAAGIMVSADVIRNEGTIDGIPGPWRHPDEIISDPDFIGQRIIFEIRENG